MKDLKVCVGGDQYWPDVSVKVQLVTSVLAEYTALTHQTELLCGYLAGQSHCGF